jgi:hypothetical protein
LIPVRWPLVTSGASIHLAVVFAGLAGFFAHGCSAASQPPLERACRAFANIQSIRKTSCYGVAHAPDEATLISRGTKSCELVSSAPGSMVGADYWNTCASEANNDCVGFKCATYPSGTRQVGEPCLVDNQCATLWCKSTTVIASDGSVPPEGLQCGKCAARLPEGSSCNAAIDACDIDFSCFQGSCRSKGQAGAHCLHWSDCAFPWVCLSSGICGEVLQVGETCSSSLECTTDFGCDMATKVCASVEYGQAGDTCDGEVFLCESGSCNMTAGTCPAVLADGAPCDPSDSSTVCQAYARCFQGTCQIADPASCQ